MPVVAPKLIAVAAPKTLAVVVVVLNSVRVVALVAIVALFMLVVVAAMVALAFVRLTLLTPAVNSALDDVLVEPILITSAPVALVDMFTVSVPPLATPPKFIVLVVAPSARLRLVAAANAVILVAVEFRSVRVVALVPIVAAFRPIVVPTMFVVVLLVLPSVSEVVFAVVPTLNAPAVARSRLGAIKPASA